MSRMKLPESVFTDFSDSIGPMVVKELRQGLRARSFTWAFLFVQLLLLIFMVGGFVESSDSRDTAGSFWFLLQVALLVVMPLRGLNALNVEVKLNTMELISLTRMSAWRITVGKWLALMSQSVLLAIAVLPYIVLRYFFGGMNVVAELVLLLVVIGLSGLVTALMVGLSVVSNFLIRCFFTVPVLILVFRFLGESVYRVSRGDGVAPFNLEWEAWLCIVPAAIFLGCYLLDMAASRIAPEAVNYVTRRRIAALCCFGASLVLSHFWAVPAALLLSFSFLGLFAIDALSEHPPTVSSVYEPFRRLPGGRILETFFAPGWCSGTWFIFLLSALMAVAALLSPQAWISSDLDSAGMSIAMILSVTASLMLPLAIMLLSRPTHPEPVVSYCLTGIFLVTIAVSMMPFVERGDLPGLIQLVVLLPPLSIFAIFRESVGSHEPLMFSVVQVLVLLFSVAVVLWKNLRVRRAMAQARREDLSV
ncbi:MAG: hypothetical protein DVB23_000385 [Verrucomicrobia bacterium]|nr:MAG: hypothetical protein DVB23_000385 [Verrucomicrobiota bacterium]